MRFSAFGKDHDAFVVHDAEQREVELKRELIGTSLVTPYARFFVRNHLDPPAIDDPDGFAIAVDGVANPGTITVAELRAMPPVETAAVLQCAGNGRGYHPNRPSGSPWQVGAAGLGCWTGVLLADVATRFGGPAPGTRFLTATGSEPAGAERRVERSIPIEKALRDVLLALRLNDEPLPVAHGGPVRLLVPGYFAINSVKYPGRLAFTAEETDAPIMARDYRSAPIDAGGISPSDPPCWAMPVKSWITAPLGDRRLAHGPITVCGVAFAGEHAVERVEVTTDGGRSWIAAALVGPDLGPAAWRQFSATFEAAPGTYTLASRATDERGRVQPEHLTPNLKGYQANGWHEPAVAIVVR